MTGSDDVRTKQRSITYRYSGGWHWNRMEDHGVLDYMNGSRHEG